MKVILTYAVLKVSDNYHIGSANQVNTHTEHRRLNIEIS